MGAGATGVLATGVVATGAVGATTAQTVSGELTLRGTARPLVFTAKVTDAGADAATLEAEVPIDRIEHGVTVNKVGMIKGPTFVTVKARYTRSA